MWKGGREEEEAELTHDNFLCCYILPCEAHAAYHKAEETLHYKLEAGVSSVCVHDTLATRMLLRSSTLHTYLRATQPA